MHEFYWKNKKMLFSLCTGPTVQVLKKKKKKKQQQQQQQLQTCIQTPPKYSFGYWWFWQRLHFIFFFLFFLAQCMNSSRTIWLFNPFQHIRSHEQYTRLTNLTFQQLFIKNESHGTIHTFKNYFATVFSVFNFSKISYIQTEL